MPDLDPEGLYTASLDLTGGGQLNYLVMGSALIVIMIAATCVCWMKKHASAENLGLPGRIKVTNHDETAVNGTSNYAGVRDESRFSALQRELPQIPTVLGAARRDSSVPSEPTSELYAVVADPGARPPPAAAAAPPAAAPAAAAGEAPNYETMDTARGEGKEEEQDEYYEQPAVARARSERQNSVPPQQAHSRNASASSGEIAARLAVCGGVPASQELPYMTPPVARGPPEPPSPAAPVSAPAPATAAAQQHFSGDSVHSADSRGYTRITVREPAAELSLRSADRSPRTAAASAAPSASAAPLPADNFYATVDGSDDDMYEAIPERRRRAGQPPVLVAPPPAAVDQPDGAVAADPAGSAGAAGDAATGGAAAAASRAGSIPPPPSVDSLRQALVHSRQASCSSVASSSTSPPAERRSARSPLPPLPPDLDQLYAKVQKPPRGGATTPPTPAQLMPAGDHHQPLPVNYSDFEVVRDPIRHNRPVVRRESSLDPNYESIETRASRRVTAPPSVPGADEDDDDEEEFGYDRVRRIGSSAGATVVGSEDGAGYARVRRLSSGRADVPDPSAPVAAPLRRREHHYERVRRRRDEDPLYEKISGSPATSEVYDEIRWAAGRRPPPSDVESFYESVRFGSESGDVDPNYELLPGGSGPAMSETDELYASIWDRSTPATVQDGRHGSGRRSGATSATVEDPYASIRRSSTSPPYESITRPEPTESDSDSDTIGYESVRAAPSSVPSSGGGAGDGGVLTEVVDGSSDETTTSAITPVDLSQLYARVQKVQRQTVAITDGDPVLPPPIFPYQNHAALDSAPSLPPPLDSDAAPPIPDSPWTVAPPESADDSGAAMRLDSSSASTSQYTSASEAGTPLLPKRLDDLGSPRRRRSTTSVDSGSVTQSDRDDLMAFMP